MAENYVQVLLLYGTKNEQQLASLFKKHSVYIRGDGSHPGYHCFGEFAPTQKELWEKVARAWKRIRRETTKNLLRDINYGNRQRQNYE